MFCGSHKPKELARSDCSFQLHTSHNRKASAESLIAIELATMDIIIKQEITEITPTY